MGMFNDEINAIAGESVFTNLELQKLFRTDAEREAFVKVRTALAESTNINETTMKLMGSGVCSSKIVGRVSEVRRPDVTARLVARFSAIQRGAVQRTGSCQ